MAQAYAQLLQLLEKHLGEDATYHTTREGDDDNVPRVFLDQLDCPTGLTPCDETTGECPDDGVWPKIYNSASQRCYTRGAVAHKRMSKKDRNTAVTKLRELVNNVASMQGLLVASEAAVKTKQESEAAVKTTQKPDDTVDEGKNAGDTDDEEENGGKVLGNLSAGAYYDSDDVSDSDYDSDY